MIEQAAQRLFLDLRRSASAKMSERLRSDDLSDDVGVTEIFRQLTRFTKDRRLDFGRDFYTAEIK